MKTLSRTSKVVILAASGVVAILSFRAFAQPYPKPSEPPASKATFVLKIKNFTPVKDAAHFEDVLTHLKTQLYDVVIHEKNGTQKHLLQPKLNIKTDKVTTSEVAKDTSTGGFTRNPGMTRNIASMHLSDIKTVLDELQE